MGDEILILGLPTREHARHQFSTWVRRDDMRRVKWIRVAQQLEGRAGGVLFILEDGAPLLELEVHRELAAMILARSITKSVVTPLQLSRILVAQRETT